MPSSPHMYMVNNLNFLKQRYAYTSALFFISILIPCSSFSQNLSKHYVSNLQDEYTLYFIKPLKNWHNKDLKSEFEYDITYADNNDSIIISFSYTGKQVRKIKTLQVGADPYILSSNTTKLFIEPIKKQYISRYNATFLFEDINQLLNRESSPLSFSIITVDNISIPLTAKEIITEKQKDILQQIFAVIAINQ